MPSRPPSDPQRQLQWLIDRAEISELLLAFARALDEHDHAAYVATFTEDAVLELPFGTFTGQAAILAMKPPTPPIGAHHVSANHQIDIDGDRAATRSYLVATHVFDMADPLDTEQAGGWYDCRYRRTAEGWRFERVKLTIRWLTGDMFRGARPSV